MSRKHAIVKRVLIVVQLVGLSPFGTDNFLRTRLRAHLGGLKRDDRVIREEGLDTLTDDELRQACRARAMRAVFGDGARAFMKQSMEEWLELSLDRCLISHPSYFDTSVRFQKTAILLAVVVSSFYRHAADPGQESC